MPELPDVEVFRRSVQRTSLGKRIRGVELTAPEMLEDTRPRALTSGLKGSRLKSTRRRGKYLFTELDRGGWLLLHFGMSGDVEYSRSDVPADHVRLRLDFDDGSYLAFRDVRKLGRIGLVDALKGRKAAVKAALMDQHVLAGVGNIYGDEILFQAGVHPEARTDRLSDDTIKRIHGSMSGVLEAAIKAKAQPDRFPSSFLIPRRSKGGCCPRCGRELTRITVGGRSTWFCAADQKRRR